MQVVDSMQTIRQIVIAADIHQSLAIECLNDTWMRIDKPQALANYAPAQRPAHQPMHRAGTWRRTGDPRAKTLEDAGDTLLLMLLGEELLYWDQTGMYLHLPGVPGLLAVRSDSEHTPALELGETDAYFAVGGVVAIHVAPEGLPLLTGTMDRLYTLTVLESPHSIERRSVEFLDV